MAKHIRLRGGTADEWTEANPVLKEREVGFEIDSFTESGGVRFYVFKIGDGSTEWNDLPRAGFAPVPSSSGGGGSVAWADITGKPTTFAPSAHTHAWDEVTGKPSTFTPSSHTHAWDEVTGKPTSFTPSAHTHAWDAITDKPSSFTPSAHGHAIEDITGLGEALDDKAASSHSHGINDVTGLQLALDGKMDATKLWPIITAPQSNLTAGLIRYQNVGASGTPLTSAGTAEGTVPHALTVHRMRTRAVMGSAVAGSAATAQLVVNGSPVATINIPVGSTTNTYEAVIEEPIVVPDNARWYLQYNAPSGSAIQFNNVTLSVS